MCHIFIQFRVPEIQASKMELCMMFVTTVVDTVVNPFEGGLERRLL